MHKEKTQYIAVSPGKVLKKTEKCGIINNNGQLPPLHALSGNKKYVFVLPVVYAMGRFLVGEGYE